MGGTELANGAVSLSPYRQVLRNRSIAAVCCRNISRIASFFDSIIPPVIGSQNNRHWTVTVTMPCMSVTRQCSFKACEKLSRYLGIKDAEAEKCRNNWINWGCSSYSRTYLQHSCLRWAPPCISSNHLCPICCTSRGETVRTLSACFQDTLLP